MEIQNCFDGEAFKYQEKVLKGWEVEGTTNYWCNYIGQCKYKDIIEHCMYCYEPEFRGLEPLLSEELNGS